MFGVMSSQISSQVYCTEEAIWAKEDKDTITNCTALLNENEIKN